ncbi:hypothetical protein GCM10027341_53820 [Spirosoma knui]
MGTQTNIQYSTMSCSYDLMHNTKGKNREYHFALAFMSSIINMHNIKLRLDALSLWIGKELTLNSQKANMI